MLFKDISFDLFYIHIIDNLGSCVLLSVAVAKFFIIMVASIIYTPIHNSVYKVLLFSYIHMYVFVFENILPNIKRITNIYVWVFICIYIYYKTIRKCFWCIWALVFFSMCVFFFVLSFFFNKICQTNLSVVFFSSFYCLYCKKIRYVFFSVVCL